MLKLNEMLPIINVNWGIEIPVFLIFFSQLLGAPILNNFVMYRTCYVIMERNESQCAQLGINTTANATIALEKDVQAISNYINVILEVFTMIMPCIICLFVGPYSDKKGRRNIMIISSAGMGVSSIIRLLVVLTPNISPWYLSLQIIPTMLSGGLPTFIAVAFCYLVDVTSLETRTMRLGILEGAVGLGLISGLFLSSYIFSWIGYVGTTLVCSGIFLVAFLFIVLFVRESVKTDKEIKVKFFTLTHLKEMWHTTFQPRQGYNRTVLLGCILTMVLHIVSEAAGSSESLLLRAKFHWDLQTLTNFASIKAVAGIFGMCVCIYVLHKLLKISECVLIVFAVCANAMNAGIIAFAEYDWQIYAGAAIKVPGGLISPMVRSLVTNIIPPEETGKIFSFCISIESFCGILAGPLFTVIYTTTIDVFPGAFYLIPVGIYIGIALYFIYVYFLTKQPNAVVFLENKKKKCENPANITKY